MQKHVCQLLQMNRAGCQVASVASVALKPMKGNAKACIPIFQINKAGCQVASVASVASEAMKSNAKACIQTFANE